MGTYQNRLELIDLVRRDTRSLGEGYVKASWSPDGRWIAALENGGKWRTVLIDAGDFTKKRTLVTTEVEWSPDSRYLLRVKPCPRADSGTIETLNVDSGEVVAIESSKCKVNQTTTGWLSNIVIPARWELCSRVAALGST